MNVSAAQEGDLVKRHRFATRLWHWVNVVAVIIMVMSGLMISNAHPHLYWGHYGANFDHAWIDLPRFPGWMTIPSTYSLAGGRHWHLFFAWIFAWGYVFWLFNSLINGHIRRAFTLKRADLTPRHLLAEIVDHARLRFPAGLAALDYNSLQKWSYIAVLFGLIPLLILTGLCLMPGLSPLTGWLIDLFGGRQSARSLHFIAMALMVLFIVVHVAMVLLAGPFNEMRAMITGWFRLPHERDRKGKA